jgi:hypothetical protein
MTPFLRKLLVALPLFAGAVMTVPHRLAGWEADAHFEGDAAVQERLARGLRDTTGDDLVTHPFRTGSPHFDSEWLFGTYMMAGMGFGQLALAHPEREPELVADMERCVEGMLGAPAKAYDRTTWGEDPLADATLEGTRGHVAYLGYLNLVLGLLRRVAPKNRYAALNDRVSAALERRFRATSGFVETFPDATFPVDNASAIGSLGLHQRATGASHEATILAFRERTNRLVRQDDGLLVQIVGTDGSPRDVGRGSGTFLAAYFTAFADRELSASLYSAGKRALYKEYAGFGTMREHAKAHPGSPDIDAGPVLFGLGVSSSGFAVGPARAHRDREAFRGLVSLVHLFGLPVDSNGTRTYTTGGPIGDAILFAMLTAPPPESVAPELTASRGGEATLAAAGEGGVR